MKSYINYLMFFCLMTMFRAYSMESPHYVIMKEKETQIQPINKYKYHTVTIYNDTGMDLAFRMRNETEFYEFRKLKKVSEHIFILPNKTLIDGSSTKGPIMIRYWKGNEDDFSSNKSINGMTTEGKTDENYVLLSMPSNRESSFERLQPTTPINAIPVTDNLCLNVHAGTFPISGKQS